MYRGHSTNHYEEENPSDSLPRRLWNMLPSLNPWNKKKEPKQQIMAEQENKSEEMQASSEAILVEPSSASGLQHLQMRPVKDEIIIFDAVTFKVIERK